MRKKYKLAVYALAGAMAVASFIGGADDNVQAEEIMATDTDAVATDDLNVQTEVPYYNININGGKWDENYYVVNGTTVTDAFFCDGTYTYYLQADGTPMKDRLTYHPDGEHIIYFDANGHEVFSDFAMVKKSISGEAVDDMCFFDIYGYMYINQLTYDKNGTKIYYINECGVIERNKWFQFPEEVGYFSNSEALRYLGISRYGYATADGSLMTNQFTYNWLGQMVYLGGDGITLEGGLYNLGGTYYLCGFNGGYIIEQYSQVPETYTLTLYYEEDVYDVYTYEGKYDNCISIDSYEAGKLCGHSESTYNADGYVLTSKGYGKYLSWNATYGYDEAGNTISYHFEQIEYDEEQGKNITHTSDYIYSYYESGNIAYEYETDYCDDVIYTQYEYYFADSDEAVLTGDRGIYYLNGKKEHMIERLYDETRKCILERTIGYDISTGEELYRETVDGNGNVIE